MFEPLFKNRKTKIHLSESDEIESLKKRVTDLEFRLRLIMNNKKLRAYAQSGGKVYQYPIYQYPED